MTKIEKTKREWWDFLIARGGNEDLREAVKIIDVQEKEIERLRARIDQSYAVSGKEI